MGREILFKAKRTDNGEWVEGYYCIKKPYCFDNRTSSKAIIITEHSSTGTVSFEVDTDTICQYTGLTDKNGNKIWENDVVALDSLGGFLVEYDNENTRFIFNGEYKDKDYGHCGFHLYAQKEIEVIGNVFDNPELMKEE